ncbi:hypothetical protein JZ751_010319 [Albula glossodonta]|uniref:ShKT domain-containing protein n=1 Tax=Albula glossodonta TaxID=121402 RepID=A0A8T2NWW7_9TELE|nr:hypothetical protein JZ751_010319 [Albula glossodonta]
MSSPKHRCGNTESMMAVLASSTFRICAVGSCDFTMTMFVFSVGLLVLLQGCLSLGQLRWADTCAMNHSPDSRRTISTSGCGENLYMSSAPNSWSDAIQSWYDEVKDYRYGYGALNGAVVGHYTQLVWYRSNEIGCGVAYCPNSQYQYFYVCQYCPPGNYQYAHPYKAGPPCGDCPNACDHKLCTNPCPYIDKYSNCASLKSQYGCSGDIGSWCPASCKCQNKIMTRPTGTRQAMFPGGAAIKAEDSFLLEWGSVIGLGTAFRPPAISLAVPV